MHEGSKRAILAALFANLGIAVAKLVGYAITQSASMLAEAIHSLADTGNQALLLLGGSRARKEATPTHPFGYGRERYFWSFAVSLVLFSIGGLFALTEGIDKFRHPHELDSVWVAIGDPRVRDRPRDLLAADRDPGGEPRQAARASATGSSSARRSSPSCRWCCSRTPAPSWACSPPSAGS